MGWIYFTSIDPTDKVNSFTEAFDIFLNQCLINRDRISQQLSENQCYRFIIKTDEENDKIICNDGKVYLKSRFLLNKNFKKCLIDYYRPMKIFIKGPHEILRKDGSSMNKWMIELVPMYTMNS